MNPIERAVWFIESHSASEMTLDDIAEIGGVSRYHMTRAFATVTGHSVMRYVRRRRLTEAAKSLSNGASDILSVALDAGYASHEAFTRAFRDQFGVTPEAIRAQRDLSNIDLVEPLNMTETLLTHLDPPRCVNGRRLLIGGLGERYTSETGAAIPSQWQRFQPHLGHVPGQVNNTTYGVCCYTDDAGNFDYICGVEIREATRLPAEWRRVQIPEHRYAVFSHRDHISTIRSVWNTIWNTWLPASGYQVAEAADFERYGEEFDPTTGMGGFEIWVPIMARAKR